MKNIPNTLNISLFILCPILNLIKLQSDVLFSKDTALDEFELNLNGDILTLLKSISLFVSFILFISSSNISIP